MTGLTAETSARTVARGARVNALGVIARLAQPLALILLTRWYGPDQVGVYLLSIAVVETVAALAGSGMQDALIAFLSPLDPASPRAHRLLASGFVLAGAGAAAGLALTLAAAALAPAWLPQVASASTLWLMAPAVPLVTFIGVVVAATRARFTQTWDVVLQGVARPLLIIAFAAAFALGAPALPQWGRASVLSQWGRASVPALAASYLLAHLVLAIAAAVVLARHYRWASVLRAARGLPIDRGLLAFAWPQNLNLALFALSGSASVLALGVAGLTPRDIALFGAAFAIASSLRHVRLVFTSAMSPVAAALLARGDRAALQDIMTRSTRWTLSIALPIAAAMILLRNPLLGLFHPTYALGAADDGAARGGARSERGGGVRVHGAGDGGARRLEPAEHRGGRRGHLRPDRAAGARDGRAGRGACRRPLGHAGRHAADRGNEGPGRRHAAAVAPGPRTPRSGSLPCTHSPSKRNHLATFALHCARLPALRSAMRLSD